MSGTPLEFARRAETIRLAGELAVVNSTFTEDDFKTSLGSLGCETREDVRDVISQLRKANVPLQAVAAFLSREGL